MKQVKRIARRLVKKLFSYLGVGIYRLTPTSKKQRRPQRFVVRSTLHRNTRERVNELFADLEFVQSYLSPERIRFYEEVVEFLRKSGVDYNGKRVADAGCGPGGLLYCIHSRFNPSSLSGFDHSEQALEIARGAIPDAEFYCLDIYEKTHLKFDIIFCTEVLEHLLFPDKALKNLLEMMDKPGVAFLTVPDGRKDKFEGHINFWSPESWSVFVKSVCDGYDVEIGVLDSIGCNFAIISR